MTIPPNFVGRACFLVFLWAGYVQFAKAEGGTCPPGYYPHNVPGVMGCAPIPGYGGESQTGTPLPTWATRWGAIAIDDKTGNFGGVERLSSKRKAKKAAISECESYGGKNCKVTLMYYNQCAALVWGRNFVVSQGAADSRSAEKLAIEACEKDATECKLVYLDCSLPERIK